MESQDNGEVPMLKAGIVGLGRIASLLERDPLRPKPCTHAGHYRKNPRTILTCGADLDQARRGAFQHDWDLRNEAVFEEYQEMLEIHHPDIVSVCAYAPERECMCLQAIAAGARGLWIEKALGCSLVEAVRINRAIHEAGITAVVDYPRRARSPYRVVRRIIESQSMGALQTVTCHMSGQFLHTGTHAWDILRYWCGEVVALRGHCEKDPFDSDHCRDTGGTGTLQFDSGVEVFVAAQTKKFYIFQFDLVFEQGRIQLGNDLLQAFRPGPSMQYSGFQELFPVTDVDWSDPHREDLLQDLLIAMDSGKQPIASVANAVEALRIGLGFFESHRRRGAWITPDEVPEDLKVLSR
jgi:predicted dehydrogenase